MQPWRPVHLRAFDYLGPHRYSLRFCTDQRTPLFTSPALVSIVLSQILRAGGEHAFAVVAYCFMPDHLHLLVEGTAPDSDLRTFVARAKQYSGYRVATDCGVRLWQRYGRARAPLRRRNRTGRKVHP
jgi:putative transposase